MSMTGKLKASTNRVRTSVAHNTHSIWTNAVGLEQAGGNNAAVENSLNAPQFAGSRGSRRAAAAEAVEKTGGFDTAVEDYQALLSLARSQGAVGGQNRGACKICGQLGHLTKQCRNHLSAHFQMPGATDTSNGAAARPAMPMLPTVGGDPDDLSSDLSDLESSSGSDSSSDSADEKRKQKEKEKKRKRKEHSKSSSKKHKHKKEKKSKHSKHKSKKRQRHESSDSD